MKKSHLALATLLSCTLLDSGVAATDPVSVTATTALPDVVSLNTTYNVVYTFTNNTSRVVSSIEFAMSGTNGTLAQTATTCGSTIAAAGTCTWSGTFTPTSEATSYESNLTLKYSGIEVPVKHAMTQSTGPLFVAMGIVLGGEAEGTYVATSDNGLDWSVLTSALDGGEILLHSAAYGNGLWVAVGSNQAEGEEQVAIYTSSDGVNWTAVEGLPLDTQLSKVAYYNGTWVAVGENDLVMVSTASLPTQASNWHVHDIGGSDEYLYDVIHVGDQWVAYYADGTVFTRSDSASWSNWSTGISFPSTAAGELYLGGTTVSDDYLLVAGGTGHDGSEKQVYAVDSSDLSSYQGYNLTPDGGVIFSVTGNGGSRWVAVGSEDGFGEGSSAAIYYSNLTNASTWQSATLPSSGLDGYPLYAAHSAGKWAAVGLLDDEDNHPAVLTSNDGMTWSVEPLTDYDGTLVFFDVAGRR